MFESRLFYINHSIYMCTQYDNSALIFDQLPMATPSNTNGLGVVFKLIYLSYHFGCRWEILKQIHSKTGKGNGLIFVCLQVTRNYGCTNSPIINLP